jgi:hypothetical protein
LLRFFPEHGFFAVADQLFISFLGAFAKLPEVRMQKLGSHWSDFHEI